MDDEWREVIAEWKGDSAFIGRDPAGGEVQMGTLNGRPGISPMELLLVGLAGCTGVDIASILTKKRQPLQDLKVCVRGKRANAHPKVYTEIEVIYLLWGDGINPAAVEQAIQLSEEKYCSASAMMRNMACIRSSYRILEPGAES